MPSPRDLRLHDAIQLMQSQDKKIVYFVGKFPLHLQTRTSKDLYRILRYMHHGSFAKVAHTIHII